MWKWKIGTVVREKDGSCGGFYTGLDARPMFGHVIGFDNNPYETIIRVRWEDGSERPIHPNKVFTEEDGV